MLLDTTVPNFTVKDSTQQTSKNQINSNSRTNSHAASKPVPYPNSTSSPKNETPLSVTKMLILLIFRGGVDDQK